MGKCQFGVYLRKLEKLINEIFWSTTEKFTGSDFAKVASSDMVDIGIQLSLSLWLINEFQYQPLW